MRSLRELKQGVWYEVHTSVNNRKLLFQSRKAIRLFARVLDDTSARFDFEIRGLRLKGCLLVFCVKPADGFQLPRIMQWLKQTFAVRYNFMNGWTGHIWGNRYRSKILEGEPPEGVERWTETVGNAAEISPTEGGASFLFWRMKARVRPLPGKPVKITRKSTSPPA